MPSTFLGLNTGLSGLNYYQATLNTTGHNISNADTKGYSRQQVLSTAADALRLHTAYGMMGTGVKMTGIEQLRNIYYDTKYRAATSKLQEYTGIKEQLTQLETYLNEMKSESGYTKVGDALNAALQDLARSPSDATYRTQFIQAADNFTDLINEAATNYQNTQQDINAELAVHVSTINSISAQIYTLNQQIMNVEVRGGVANDLRDQRELLVDQLSELVNVTVTETPIMYGTGKDATESGATRYEVRIGDTLLVDEMQCRQLKVVAREEKVNQNDIDGLYDVYWMGLNNSVGEKFNFNSNNVTGLMKGLLEARDGNNANPFAGTIESYGGDPADIVNGVTVKINVDGGIHEDKLNLPMEGTITLNCKDYYYEGFEAEYDTDGKLVSFTFQNLTSVNDTGERIPATPRTGDVGKEAMVGERIDCKGIPYYMTQLNEFVRTMSHYMNEIYKQGVDANGDAGMDFYTANNPVTGTDYVLPNDADGATGISTSNASYYHLTALNWAVNVDIQADQSKLVVSTKDHVIQGDKEAKDILDKIIYGMTDQNMYTQGTIAQFLQSITTSLAVDVSKYDAFSTNMDEVATVIDNQRLSISSVDTNEEASNLVVFQNGYNLASKVISVMNEVYDKLINQTGV